MRAGLLPGRELERPLACALARELRRSRALARAGRMLARRDLSVHALDARLEAGGVAPAARREALETLERAGLVDDGRFAVGRAELLAGRGHGDAAIRAELERQGVDPKLVAEAIAGLEPERERAARIVGRRGRVPATARYLAARGFEAEAVEAALAGLVAGDV